MRLEDGPHGIQIGIGGGTNLDISHLLSLLVSIESAEFYHRDLPLRQSNLTVLTTIFLRNYDRKEMLPPGYRSFGQRPGNMSATGRQHRARPPF
jgi:hypothetical protein